MLGDGIVEAQTALVAQQQDHRCDEALRHRCDAERAIDTGQVAGTGVQFAEAGRVHEFAIGDDAPRESGRAALGEPLRKDRLCFGDASYVDLRHVRASQSWPPRADGVGVSGRSCMAGIVRVPAMRL